MSKVFIIAEAGVNHNGDVNVAFKMVEAAKNAGVDAIKFQTFKTEKIVSRFAPMAQYQIDNCEDSFNQLEMLKKLELSYDEFAKIKDYCDMRNIEFMSTPDEEESLNFLSDILKINRIKIGSGEVNNLPYLREVGKTKKDIILSTGMSTMAEIKSAVYILKKNGAKSVSLLHCNTDYPTKMADVNLRAMLGIRETLGCEVGYSDHTLGNEVAVAAVALGASIIEKHFTLDKKFDGPDHCASIDDRELRDLVLAIRNIEEALGDDKKKVSDSEKKNMDVVRKSIVAKCYIKKGETFCKENITTKRPGTGTSPMCWDEIIGKTATKDFGEDEMIII